MTIDTQCQQGLLPQGLSCQMAAEVQGGGRQPGGSRRPAVHLHPPRPVAVEVRANDQRHRAPAREFRRRIKTQAVLPDAETAPMLFWALLASGQIVMRKVDGWQTLSQPLDPETLDLAA